MAAGRRRGKEVKLPWNKIALMAAAAVIVIVLAVVMTGKKPVPVKVLEIKRGELRVIVNATTTSTVKSEYEVTLSAQRTGRVVTLPVREGDRVKAGDLIARLDLTEESVQSESVLAQSRATYEEAEKNLKRSEDLFANGMIAQQDLDSARRAFQVARSQYDASRDDVKVKKDYSVIRTPFGGVVSKKYTEVGELLLPGKQIVTVVDPDRIYVLATIDEVDVGRLRLGQPVAISIDAFPGERFNGSIRRISPIVSGGKLETRTADVWIYFTAKDARIKPGMSADVEILITTLTGVLSAPSQAIVEREGKKQVYIAEGTDLAPGATTRVHLRPVEIGESNWVSTEIRNGLKTGEFVVTTPETEGLKDGVRIIVEKEKNPR
ncbi:MAG: efflux RND transporter periplasmic adaptor subunit [Nitrospirae bacterium]|nr:efflux RND transporter periplasmic adaptor subunit [Nitrospirota bacterium]